MRIVCSFSCGAASAVATKLAIANKPVDAELVIVNFAVEEEHEDNQRFLRDCEQWFGQPIVELWNEKYEGSIYKVFESAKYISNAAGAPCTLRLKKDLDRAFRRPGDRLVLGYTMEEQERVDRFIDANNDIDIWPILVEKSIGKSDCLALIERAGIELPAMYKLGYEHNNCIGCAKASGAGYWNKIRDDFPVQFDRMAELSRRLGARMTRYKGERIFLDELPRGYGNIQDEPSVQCGVFCEMAEREFA